MIKLKRWLKNVRIKIMLKLLEQHVDEIEEYQARWLTVHLNDKKTAKEMAEVLKRRLLY